MHSGLSRRHRNGQRRQAHIRWRYPVLPGRPVRRLESSTTIRPGLCGTRPVKKAVQDRSTFTALDTQQRTRYKMRTSTTTYLSGQQHIQSIISITYHQSSHFPAAIMHFNAPSIISALLFALHPSLTIAAPGAVPGELVARSSTCALGGKHIGDSCSKAYAKDQFYACGNHRVVRLLLPLSSHLCLGTHVMIPLTIWAFLFEQLQCNTSTLKWVNNYGCAPGYHCDRCYCIED